MKLFNTPYMDEEPGAAGGADAPVVEPVVAAAPEGNWYDGLPQDMREDQNITKFESVETMAKSWLNAQRLIGADKIPMPQTDDDWGNVFNKLGRPEDVSGYKIDAPEGAEVNADMQASFLAKAHEIGLLPQQVQALAAWEFENGAAGQEASAAASEQALTDAMNSLKSEWGQAFDQNTGIAKRAISEFASDADKDFLSTAEINGVKLGDHPALARLFNNVGKSMMENGKLEGLGSEQAMTPQDMQDKTQSLMAHPAYTDRKHPEHKQVNRQVQELFKQQYG